MKTVFVKNGTVVAVGTAYVEGARISTTVPDAIPCEVGDDLPVDVGYAATTAEDGSLVFTAQNPVAPKVGPIHFQMLFRPGETVAADELKATDKVLASFWKLIDDPRTDVVDLGLQSVQNAIEYTLTAVKKAGVDVDVQVRKSEIFTGVLK